MSRRRTRGHVVRAKSGRSGGQGNGAFGSVPVDLQALRTSLETTFVGRCVTAFVELHGLDRAMIIASQSFTALMPLLILVSAVLPTQSGSAVADSIVRRFELTGQAAESVQLVFAQSEPGSVGIGSLVLLMYSGVSLTRRLQQMYLSAYRIPRVRGVRSSFNATLGLAALLVEIALLYLLQTIVQALSLHWSLGAPLSILTGLVLWTTVPYLLLDRRIAWQRLLPGGALAGLAVSIYGVATDIYMSPLIASYSARYGLFGVTVAIVGWLLCMCFILVAATVVAGELDRSPEEWARRVRARLNPREQAAGDETEAAGNGEEREEDGDEAS